MAAQKERKVKFRVADGFQDSYDSLVIGNPKASKSYKEFLERKGKIPPERLPNHMDDHGLVGRLAGIRECHLDGDVLLLYTHENDVVHMLDVCEHDDLYGGKSKALAKKLKGFI